MGIIRYSLIINLKRLINKMRVLLLILFGVNQMFAQNNELLGKGVMIDECSFLNKGDMNTKYCQSQLGINRESYIIYNEDGTYSDYYKNLDWERSLFDIDYSDYTEGTYTIEDGFCSLVIKLIKANGMNHRQQHIPFIMQALTELKLITKKDLKH